MWHQPDWSDGLTSSTLCSTLDRWRKSRQPRAIWWIGLMSHWLILFNLMLSCPNKRIAGKNAKLLHVIMFKIYWSEFGCYFFPLVSIVFTLVMLDIPRQAPYWGMQRKNGELSESRTARLTRSARQFLPYSSVTRLFLG